MTLIEHVQSIYRRVARWWRPTPRVEPPSQPPPRKPVLQKAQFDVDSGEFFFREAILDQLDYYFTCIKRMRRRDPDAFALYSRMGALVMPRPLMQEGGELIGLTASPWFARALPDFGSVFFGDVAQHYEAKAKGKSVWPRFFYFRKYQRGHGPHEIEPVHGRGAIYVITCHWDLDANNGGPTDFAMLVEPNGAVRLLRQRTTEKIVIRHKRRRAEDHGPPCTMMERAVWSKGGSFMKMWASDKGAPADLLAARLFAEVTTLFELASASMIRVSINRDDLTAAFSVNIKRTPYFFKDRELQVNENGRRKRIFHIVRPHVRASGSAVRMHFRGERSFDWNGYRVVITVPGKHHHDMTEFNVGLVDSGDAKAEISMARFGQGIRNHIQGGADLRAELFERKAS